MLSYEHVVELVVGFFTWAVSPQVCQCYCTRRALFRDERRESDESL